MSTTDVSDLPEGPTPNRAARRAGGHRSRKLGALGSGAVLASSATAAVLALGAGPAAAATLLVDTNADGAANPTDCTTPVAGSCSLRDAVAAAADGDTVTFAPSVTGDINLTDGHIDIATAITITGPGAAVLAVHADANERVLNEGQNLAAGELLTITGLTITGGDNSNGGGGMEMDCTSADTAPADLVLDSVVITGNTTNANGGGFYFYNCGDLTIRNSTISYNHAGNGGGGIRVTDSQDLTIVDTTIAHNTSDDDGGGLYLTGAEGTVTITNTTWDTNHAGDEEEGDMGGAAVVYQNPDAQGITFANSTITGNIADFNGGGLYLYGSDVQVLNTTVVGNTAADQTGGIHIASGDLTLTASLTGNNTDAGGSDAAATDVGTQELDPSAVAAKAGKGGGSGGQDTPRPAAQQVGALDVGSATLTANVIEGLVDPNLIFTDGGGNHLGVDPGVGALADNGGPTQTLALLPGSGAIDAAGASVPSFPGNEFDQRGTGYSRLVNGALDAGAFEVQALAVVPRFTG